MGYRVLRQNQPFLMGDEITSTLKNKVPRDWCVVNEVRIMFYYSLEINCFNQSWLEVCSPVVEPGGMGQLWAMSTNGIIGSSSWTRGRTSLLWGWWSTGTCCLEGLWSLLLWTYSKLAQMRSCAAWSRWPCFGRGVGLHDPQRCLRTPNILWFCDSVTVLSPVHLWKTRARLTFFFALVEVLVVPPTLMPTEVPGGGVQTEVLPLLKTLKYTSFH